jgi:hypothetical protein
MHIMIFWWNCVYKFHWVYLLVMHINFWGKCIYKSHWVSLPEDGAVGEDVTDGAGQTLAKVAGFPCSPLASSILTLHAWGAVCRIAARRQNAPLADFFLHVTLLAQRALLVFLTLRTLRLLASQFSVRHLKTFFALACLIRLAAFGVLFAIGVGAALAVNHAREGRALGVFLCWDGGVAVALNSPTHICARAELINAIVLFLERKIHAWRCCWCFHKSGTVRVPRSPTEWSYRVTLLHGEVIKCQLTTPAMAVMSRKASCLQLKLKYTLCTHREV